MCVCERGNGNSMLVEVTWDQCVLCNTFSPAATPKALNFGVVYFRSKIKREIKTKNLFGVEKSIF